MRMIPSCRLAATLFLLILVSLPGARRTHGTDWPQFRGPNRDGVWTETGILETFPKEGLKIEWRRPVGGGWPSPIVSNGRVFIFDVDLVKPMAHERVHCFAADSGKELWLFSYDQEYADWTYVPERGAGPTATPVADGDRIYIVGAYGWVHCLDAKTGRAIWENKLNAKYQIAEMSCRPSPFIDGAALIVFTGAKPNAAVIALNKETGEEIWKSLDELVSSSSPLIINAGGKRQMIVWSNTSLASIDPSNGKVFWREAMTTSGNDSVATPVLHGNRLLVSGLMLDVSGEPTEAKILWPEIRTPSKRLLSHTSTPVMRDDYIYSARTGGELVCLEAATGRQLWATNTVTKLKNGASIHITPQGNGYFLFTDEGDLIRAQLSTNGYREISRAHLIDPTWPFASAKYVYAPPAFANRHIYARNEGEAVCASLAAP